MSTDLILWIIGALAVAWVVLGWVRSWWQRSENQRRAREFEARAERQWQGHRLSGAGAEAPVRSRSGYRPNVFRILAIAAMVIAVASAGLWLYRDARGIVGSFGPAEGSMRVNINSATQEELESVPGIGPTRAAQIIAGRPWGSVDELEELNDVGPRQVEELRPFLKTEGDTEKR